MAETKEQKQLSRIRRAALAVFAEYRGKATMAMIAKRARLSEETLLTHYASKDDLFADVLALGALEMVTPGAMKGFSDILALPWKDARKPLTTYFTNYAQFVRTNAPRVKPVLQEAILRPQTFARVLAARRGAYPRFCNLVEDLQARGRVRRDVTPIALLCMVLSTAWGYGLARAVLMPDADWDDDALALMFASVLADGTRPRTRRVVKKKTKR
ncbi:TetR/AcrR family transcriptional regulator [Pendulispora albinea]|uniref:TetR/AcrR family transcriptional regulator n=1 Tax=Pendulispora albinea TaxID=2741071 RepID=A0ABZ2LXC8_9BACT